MAARQSAYKARLAERNLVSVTIIVPSEDEAEAKDWARFKRTLRGRPLPSDK